MDKIKSGADYLALFRLGIVKQILGTVNQKKLSGATKEVIIFLESERAHELTLDALMNALVELSYHDADARKCLQNIMCASSLSFARGSRQTAFRKTAFVRFSKHD